MKNWGMILGTLGAYAAVGAMAGWAATGAEHNYNPLIEASTISTTARATGAGRGTLVGLIAGGTLLSLYYATRKGKRASRYLGGAGAIAGIGALGVIGWRMIRDRTSTQDSAELELPATSADTVVADAGTVSGLGYISMRVGR